jgi:hypothetical protein
MERRQIELGVVQILDAVRREEGQRQTRRARGRKKREGRRPPSLAGTDRELRRDKRAAGGRHRNRRGRRRGRR